MIVEYINDCHYRLIINGVDNNANPEEDSSKSFDFKANRKITYLDLRRMQLASMICGYPVTTLENIESELGNLLYLPDSAVGQIVKKFALFSNSTPSVVSSLFTTTWMAIVKARNQNAEYPINSFLVSSIERNVILQTTLKGLLPFWKSLERANIYTVDDLANCSYTQLDNIRQIGPTSIQAIENFLKKYSLQLKE